MVQDSKSCAEERARLRKPRYRRRMGRWWVRNGEQEEELGGALCSRKGVI